MQNRTMSEFRRKHPVVDTVWVLATGPLIVFAVTDWFVKILPTPASVAMSAIAIAGAVAIARRWDGVDGSRSGPRSDGYRGRHSRPTERAGASDGSSEPTG